MIDGTPHRRCGRMSLARRREPLEEGKRGGVVRAVLRVRVAAEQRR